MDSRGTAFDNVNRIRFSGGNYPETNNEPPPGGNASPPGGNKPPPGGDGPPTGGNGPSSDSKPSDWQPQGHLESVQQLIQCKLIYNLRLEKGTSGRKNKTTVIYHQ